MMKPPEAMNETAVADYLRAHPDFFLRHASLLELIQLPHAEHGGTVSLIERQIEVLRDARRSANLHLSQLAEIARSNEQLLERLHELMLNLMQSNSLDAALLCVTSAVKNDFNADLVSIRLFHPAAAQRSEYIDPDSHGLPAFSLMLSKKRSICGRLTREQRQLLFADQGEEVASAVAIPLCDYRPSHPESEAIGLLGIGSVDPHRYHADMGTLFINHLGAVLYYTVLRHLFAAAKG
ncbi:MAG: DUF484 family protein [Gammaproteobacteria bacterium]|nr:DUF484 family protein [Gammaproteobacteria bacterium]